MVSYLADEVASKVEVKSCRDKALSAYPCVVDVKSVGVMRKLQAPAVVHDREAVVVGMLSFFVCDGNSQLPELRER